MFRIVAESSVSSEVRSQSCIVSGEFSCVPRLRLRDGRAQALGSAQSNVRLRPNKNKSNSHENN